MVLGNYVIKIWAEVLSAFGGMDPSVPLIAGFGIFILYHLGAHYW
jgi:hypothetical protein